MARVASRITGRVAGRVVEREGGGAPAIVIDTPSITSPADDATDIGLEPELTADTFNVSVGSDTHASSDWQTADDAGFSNIVEESLADASNLESYTVTGPLDYETEYFVRVRYRGASGAVSGWSSTVSFTTASAYSAEATAYFAAMSVQPDATRKALIDTFISGLVSNGIWAKLDAAGILRAHDAQAARLELKNPGTRTLTAVNSPTFTTDRGYAGNGTTSYLSTGFIPSTHGVNLTLNSASLGCYVSAGNTTGDNNAYLLGTTGLRFLPRRATGDTFRSNINGSGLSDFAAQSTRLGLWAVNRSGASAVQGYRNGASQGSDTDASVALDTTELFICAWNNAGSRAGTANNEIGFWFVGGSLTAGEHATLDTLWDAYVAGTP